jgi:hypothetical protein
MLASGACLAYDLEGLLEAMPGSPPFEQVRLACCGCSGGAAAEHSPAHGRQRMGHETHLEVICRIQGLVF